VDAKKIMGSGARLMVDAVCPATGAVHRMVEVLANSKDTAHKVLAENLRNETRVSAERWQRLARTWRATRSRPGSYSEPADLVFGGFCGRFARHVQGVRADVSEFASADLNGANHLGVAGHCAMPGDLHFRQFLNISRLLLLLRMRKRSLLPKDLLSLSDEASITGVISRMPSRERHGVVTTVLRAYAPRSRKQRHPTWLTPLDPAAPGTGLAIEDELAAIGVLATDSVWIELRYTWRELAAKGVMAVPTVLDGTDRYWIPAPRWRCGCGHAPTTGFGLDLRRTVPAEVSSPEVIVHNRPDQWRRAWRAANRRIAMSSRAHAERLCVMNGGEPDLMALRARHNRGLAGLTPAHDALCARPL
jgi:hypothetical protein